MRSTESNEVSSRSHQVFILSIEGTNKNEQEFITKLTFVDLAGSERPSRIGLSQQAYFESLHINSSLKQLGNVIKIVAEGTGKVPYDDHPLTKAMKDSIGCNAITIMIVNISPSIYDKQETKDALTFAKTTGTIRNLTL